MKKFCLPYAGGSSSVFAKWKTYMSRDIEIVAPELAGRGTRFNDEKYVKNSRNKKKRRKGNK